jgi:predicted ribosome quality control (RQC) complex YloA/Tae2 family protein
MVIIDNVPKDFSFIPIKQYQNAAVTQRFNALSPMLDAFYGEREAIERMRQRMTDLTRVINLKIERLQRKLCAQKTELLQCADRETLRVKGDLLSANLYNLKKGMTQVRLPNLFDALQPEIEIELDPMQTPVENIRRYYKDYRKADNAERILKDLIKKGEAELIYLDSISDAMSRAKSDRELSAIRSELAEFGYLANKTGKEGLKKVKSEGLGPLNIKLPTDSLFFAVATTSRTTA